MSFPFPTIFYYAYQKMIAQLQRIYDLIHARIICWFWQIIRKGRVIVAGPIFVRTSKRGEIVLGDAMRFYSSRTENPLCRGFNVIDARGGYVEIDDNTGISSTTISSRCSIKIGKRCLIGANSQIFDHNFHALKASDRMVPKLARANIKSKPVVIEDDCFVGANTIILKGTHLGARSIVAAGSVVFGLDVPADSLVRGNPAVIVECHK